VLSQVNPEYVEIAEIWKEMQKECETEECRRFARRILTSRSIREAMVYAFTAIAIDGAPCKLSDSDIEEIMKAFDNCVTDSIINQFIVASTLEDEELLEALIDVIFDCAEKHVTKTFCSD